MENNQIIKNIFKVNILVYILGIIAILIGSFKEYLILNIIIIVHELGHFLVAKLLKVDVKKIYIYPLGGITKFNMPLNTKNIIEFLILIAGPLFQNIAYFILIYLFPYDKELILIYHISLLVFNLLPIYPLDGGKLLNLFINNFLPYKKTLKLIIKISYLLVFIIFIIQKNITINVIVMLLFLVVVIHKEENKVDYVYNKFLLLPTFILPLIINNKNL